MEEKEIKQDHKIKIFISQPMKDKSNADILRERQQAIGSLKLLFGHNVEILDTFFEDTYHPNEPLYFLGKSIQFLQEADVVYFCKGWEHSNGCYIEHECAVRYNKDIVHAV